MQSALPYLSVIVASRNDNHGKNLLFRMQHFVNGLIEQANRFELSIELIIVEWNPPNHTLPLSQALHFPKSNYCQTRMIKVSQEEHLKLKNSDKIPLFQMIGKNVGIRRAKGEYILTTNIDVILSDDVIRYIKHNLRPGYSYRVDRFDVKRDVPKSSSIEEVLEFCKENILHRHTRFGTFTTRKSSSGASLSSQRRIYRKFMNYLRGSFSKNPLKFLANLLLKLYAKLLFSALLSLFKLRPGLLYSPPIRTIFQSLAKPVTPLNLNACGDFTLLSAKDWNRLRGYPEWQLFSWHIDGIFLYQARQHGIKEIDLAKCIYHIDHEGGFIADKPDELFKRLDAKGIEYINNAELDKIVATLRKTGEKQIFNDENWGLANLHLEEIIV